MKKKIICFDIDNTICSTTRNFYDNAKPKKNIIKLINKLYDQGFEIKIFTARYMGRNNENINKAKKQGFIKTKKQLKNWGLKYHKLIFGKPSFDIYVDDKSIDFKKNWYELLEKLLNQNDKTN